MKVESTKKIPQKFVCLWWKHSQLYKCFTIYYISYPIFLYQMYFFDKFITFATVTKANLFKKQHVVGCYFYNLITKCCVVWVKIQQSPVSKLLLILIRTRMRKISDLPFQYILLAMFNRIYNRFNIQWPSMNKNIPVILKTKFYKTWVLSVMTYGLQTMALTKTNACKL